MFMKNTIVSCLVIENKEGKVLAVRLNKEQVGGVWVPPGGKIELGESARECCIRESKEELNIDVEVKELVGISEVYYEEDDKHWVFLFYSGVITSGSPTPMEENITMEVAYVDRSKLNYADAIRWFDK